MTAKESLLQDIIQVMKDIVAQARDTLWINGHETVFDRLGTIFLSHGGSVSVLQKEFPEYYGDNE